MNLQIVAAVLRRLADSRTTAAQAEQLMARLDGHELFAVAQVFRAFHEADTADELHAVTMLLARWRDQPVVEALVPALRALIDEEEAGDLHKLAAADLLAHYGQPVDDQTLAERLADPAALAERMLEQVLAASEAPAAVIGFLDRLDDLPPGTVLALIDDLVTLADERAVPLLAPLAHSANGDFALAAIGALDQLIAVVPAGPAADAARAGLDLVATSHRDPAVRREAAHTLKRWPAASGRGSSVSQAGAPGDGGRPADMAEPDGTHAALPPAGAAAVEVKWPNGNRDRKTVPSEARPSTRAASVDTRGRPPRTAPSPVVPVKAPRAAAYLSAPGDAGARLVLLLWPSPHDPALADALVVYLSKGGVHEYATAELLGAADLRQLLERLAKGDVELDRVSAVEADSVLAAATAATLAAGGATAVGFAAWPQVIATIAAADEGALD